MDKFTSRYPVFGHMTNDQWNWLCNNIGTPQKDWKLSKGAVWFREEKHMTMYLLRWS